MNTAHFQVFLIAEACRTMRRRGGKVHRTPGDTAGRLFQNQLFRSIKVGGAGGGRGGAAERTFCPMKAIPLY